MQNDNTKPVKQWTFEEFTKWVTAIEGMPEHLGATFVENNINGAALIATKKVNSKDSSVSKVTSLTLLLEEISNLRIENKPEVQAIFVDHNVYFFEKS